MGISTDNQVKALKPRDQIFDTAITGARGLILRVYPSGTKTWVYRARNKETGKLERLTLGEYRTGPKSDPEDQRLSLQEAMEKASICRGLKREHGSAKRYRADQEAARRAQREAEAAQSIRDSYTVASMVDDYLKVISDEKNASGPRGQRFIRSWKEVQRCLYRYILKRDEAKVCHSKIANKPAPDVTDDDLKLILMELPPVQANRVRAHVSSLYQWGRKNKKVFHNPTELIDPNTEKARQRVLGEGEIKRLLADLPSSGLPESYQQFLRFLLLTGLRYDEAACIELANVNIDERLISWQRTKNGEPHTIILSPQALEIVESRRDQKWLFPSRIDKRKHLTKYELHPALREALCERKLRVMPFTPHDLRRTFRTGLARLGCPDTVAELAIGHKQKGILAVYNQHKYREELRVWFDKWGAEIDSASPLRDKSDQAA